VCRSRTLFRFGRLFLSSSLWVGVDCRETTRSETRSCRKRRGRRVVARAIHVTTCAIPAIRNPWQPLGHRLISRSFSPDDDVSFLAVAGFKTGPPRENISAFMQSLEEGGPAYPVHGREAKKAVEVHTVQIESNRIESNRMHGPHSPHASSISIGISQPWSVSYCTRGHILLRAA
jgi:hypothetical protein